MSTNNTVAAAGRSAPLHHDTNWLIDQSYYSGLKQATAENEFHRNALARSNRRLRSSDIYQL